MARTKGSKTARGTRSGLPVTVLSQVPRSLLSPDGDIDPEKIGFRENIGANAIAAAAGVSRRTFEHFRTAPTSAWAIPRLPLADSSTVFVASDQEARDGGKRAREALRDIRTANLKFALIRRNRNKGE